MDTENAEATVRIKLALQRRQFSIPQPHRACSCLHDRQFSSSKSHFRLHFAHSTGTIRAHCCTGQCCCEGAASPLAVAHPFDQPLRRGRRIDRITCFGAGEVLCVFPCKLNKLTRFRHLQQPDQTQHLVDSDVAD